MLISSAKETLEYTCECPNGIELDLNDYGSTVPSVMCSEWISQCISNATDDPQRQSICKAQTCGSEKAVLLDLATSSRSSVASSASDTPKTSQTTSITSQSSKTSSTSSVPSTIDSTSSSRSVETSPANTPGPEQGSQSPSKKSGLSVGAIAGIAVGAVLGIVIIGALLCLCRMRRQSTNRGAYHDDKGAPILTTSEIPYKAELDSENVMELPSDTRPSELHGGSSVLPAELPSLPSRGANELYNAQRDHDQQAGELQAPNLDNAAALHAPPSPQELGSNSPPNAAVSSLADQHVPSAQTGAQEIHNTPVLATHSIQTLSAEEIATLQEEERRIDAEKEDVRRMKELREQKLVVQQRLLNARGGS